MTQRDFKKLFPTGRWERGRSVSLRYGPFDRIKVAAVVGTRVSPKAVERNRVRRMVNGIVEDLMGDFSKPVWLAIIVNARPTDRDGLAGEISSLLGKSGIIRR